MKNSETEARRWLRQAENDLSAPELMFREGFFAQACFMAHQVAEKALKGLAYYRDDRFVTGHWLLNLVSTLEPSYPSVSVFHSLARTLDRYYIPTRYPNALPGSVPFEVYERDDADAAVSGAGQVVRAATAEVSAD